MAALTIQEPDYRGSGSVLTYRYITSIETFLPLAYPSHSSNVRMLRPNSFQLPNADTAMLTTRLLLQTAEILNHTTNHQTDLPQAT